MNAICAAGVNESLHIKECLTDWIRARRKTTHQSRHRFRSRQEHRYKTRRFQESKAYTDIQIKFLYTQQLVKEGTISIHKVHTLRNTADILTKLVVRETLQRLIEHAGLRPRTRAMVWTTSSRWESIRQRPQNLGLHVNSSTNLHKATRLWCSRETTSLTSLLHSISQSWSDYSWTCCWGWPPWFKRCYVDWSSAWLISVPTGMFWISRPRLALRTHSADFGPMCVILRIQPDSTWTPRELAVKILSKYGISMSSGLVAQHELRGNPALHLKIASVSTVKKTNSEWEKCAVDYTL